jgi:hypothetical protein
MESLVVVELQGLPWLSCADVLRWIAGGLVGLHGNFVAANVIWMRIAAVFVVGGDHVRAKSANNFHQGPRRYVEWNCPETILRERRLGIALGITRVFEPEPYVIDAEHRHCLSHFTASDFGDPVLIYLLLGERIENIATFAPSACRYEDLYALGDIAGHRCGPLARLIVGVGVDG